MRKKLLDRADCNELDNVILKTYLSGSWANDCARMSCKITIYPTDPLTVREHACVRGGQHIKLPYLCQRIKRIPQDVTFLYYVDYNICNTALRHIHTVTAAKLFSCEHSHWYPCNPFYDEFIVYVASREHSLREQFSICANRCRCNTLWTKHNKTQRF